MSELSAAEQSCLAGNVDPQQVMALLGGAPGLVSPEETTALIQCLEDETLLRLLLTGLIGQTEPLSAESSVCVRSGFANFDVRAVMLATPVESDAAAAMAGSMAGFLVTLSCLNDEEWQVVGPSVGMGAEDRDGLRCVLAELGGPEGLAAALQPGAGPPTAFFAASAACNLQEAQGASDAPAYTKAFVQQATNLYVALGLDATVAYYNTKESVDGQWYVFIIDENQTIIAHASDPDLVGKHVSQALGPNSYPTGSAVAASADQDGAWFDYTYANPASGVVETKHSWMVIHDGITFGSGWYERGPGKSDAPAYTKAFVQQATNLYVALGLDATVAYYNTKESVDGQWYVFIIDENQTIIAHASDPDLVGKHVSQALGPNSYPTGSAVAASADQDGAWFDYTSDPDLVGKHVSQALGPNSYPTGSAVAASADQDGAWFDYTYANPASGVVETKHSWMVIHDGITFGSGWYERGPGKSDAPAYTKAFVQQATNLYVALGLDATVAYYNTKESVDGQWYVFIIDENQTIIAHASDPDLVGKHVSQALGPNSYPTGSAVAASADQDGAWFDYTYANPASGVVETKHSWMVIHDGITFGSGWYERGPGKSDAPPTPRPSCSRPRTSTSPSA